MIQYVIYTSHRGRFSSMGTFTVNKYTSLIMIIYYNCSIIFNAGLLLVMELQFGITVFTSICCIC